MKIPVFKWSGIGLIAEFRGIPNGFPNQEFDYAPGQQVLKKVHNPTKLGVRMDGPYNIECIEVNGNLTILLCEGITEHINIRRVLPYH